MADFMTANLARLGRFDVTLFLGVLYHLRHPLLGLERLAQVTAGSAFIETSAIVVGGYPDAAVCEFYETNELAGDLGNWWAPGAPALVSMCRAAGFAHVELLVDPPAVADGRIVQYRAVARADR